MAISSYGYDGQIEEAIWAVMAPRLGVPYWVENSSSLVPSISQTADRTLNISPGNFGGSGVYDKSNAIETRKFDPVSSKSRWDLVVARRNWQGTGGKTDFVIIKGGAARQLPPYNRDPGNIDDQPLFLVEVDSAMPRLKTVVDLRGYGVSGKILVGDKLAMGVYDKFPGLELQVGREIYTVRGNRTWMRTGLEPYTSPAYWVKFITDKPLDVKHGRAFDPIKTNWTISGDNTMGVQALSGGVLRIKQTGVYSINVNVYDYDYSDKRRQGSVKVRLNTRDLPTVETHRHQYNGVETFLSTTGLLQEGFDLKVHLTQYNRDAKTMKYKVEVSIQMIG